MKILKDKVIDVVGASSGIGAAVSEYFLIMMQLLVYLPEEKNGWKNYATGQKERISCTGNPEGRTYMSEIQQAFEQGNERKYRMGFTEKNQLMIVLAGARKELICLIKLKQ